MTTEYGKLEKCIMGELYPKGNFETGGNMIVQTLQHAPPHPHHQDPCHRGRTRRLRGAADRLWHEPVRIYPASHHRRED